MGHLKIHLWFIIIVFEKTNLVKDLHLIKFHSNVTFTAPY